MSAGFIQGGGKSSSVTSSIGLKTFQRVAVFRGCPERDNGFERGATW